MLKIRLTRSLLAKGTITLEDGRPVDPRQTRIILSEPKKSKQIKTISLIDTASFKFEIKPGDYQLLVSHTGYKTDTINLNLPLYFFDDHISVKASLVPAKDFRGDFISIKNILFDFDSYKLNDRAVSNLENIKPILVSFPDLQLEVAGYTDAKGNAAYNRKLAENRAQSVIDYLSSSGILLSRFVKKTKGNTDYIALNTNPDGSDNPEGRKYNRRASLGIIDPQTGLIISQETNIPEHLRQPGSMQYSIVLSKSKEKFYPGYFSGIIKNDFLFIRTIKLNTISMYVLGVFYNKTDAMKYLDIAREKGFDNAYIVNHFDPNDESKAILNYHDETDNK